MTSNQGVTWHWNPPSAPHFGGVFEAMIKSSKRAINAILKDADVTDEELQTTFIGVENLMNSRPLNALSDDPNDEPVLTPNHFLIGQMGGDFIPEHVDNSIQSTKTLEASARVNPTCVGSLDEGVPTPYWLQTEVVFSHRKS